MRNTFPNPLCLGVLAVLDGLGFPREPVLQPTPAASWWIGGLTLAVGTVLLGVSSRHIRESFASVECSARALHRSNSELRASRDRYEARAQVHTNHLPAPAQNRPVPVLGLPPGRPRGQQDHG